MKIAILGYGTVGSGVYEILTSSSSACASRFHVHAVLIRKNKPKTLPIMVDDIEDILSSDVDAVVEAMGGIEPAHTYIKKCLEHKKHVVTANKAVVAKYMQEFTTLAKENDVSFLFEASTGGGIPWIHAIENVKRIDSVREFHGIFNGTSNYILDHMYKDNAEFSDILKKAQELGYAEADPSADIDGFDIQNKLQISASIAFGCYIPNTFPVFGIRNVTKTDIEFFKEKNRVLKLIAAADIHDDTYHCSIEPRLYPLGSLEASVPENFNLASIRGVTIGDLKFYGQGAGKLPTANAVVQDLIDIIEKKAHAVLLDKDLNYHPSQRPASYWIRTKSMPLEQLPNITVKAHAYLGHTYYFIQGITTDQMHAIMQNIQQEDKHAFMAAWEEDYD